MNKDVHLIYEAYGKSVIQEGGPMDWLGRQQSQFRYGAQRGWRRGESDYTAPVDPVSNSEKDQAETNTHANGLPQFTHPVDFNQIKQVIDSKRIPEPALQYLYQSLTQPDTLSAYPLKPEDKKLIEYIVSAVGRVYGLPARQQLIAKVQKYLDDNHLKVFGPKKSGPGDYIDRGVDFSSYNPLR